MKIPFKLSTMVQRINDALINYSDKDWNYSRIRLQMRPLSELNSPYVLWVEPLNNDLKRLEQEVTWGSRHSNELGILEMISLRLNKALLECTTDDHWHHDRPVIRVAPKQELEAQGIVDALWYEVEEVRGEEFDSR